MISIQQVGTTVFQTASIYLFLILSLRFLGRRQLGQLTPFDLITVLILGSAVETAMIGGDTRLMTGLVSAATLLICNAFISRLARHHKHFRRLVCGGPLLLVHDGEFINTHLIRAGLTRHEVEEALRQREIDDISTVRFAILEADGEVNVITMEHCKQIHRSKPMTEASHDLSR
ncbi:MAG: YetF domain-containing protein [Chthonomonadales bacterium]